MVEPAGRWPEMLDARRQLVADVEQNLTLGRMRYRFVRLNQAGKAVARAAPREDPTARALFAWCQDTPDVPGPTLDAVLTPQVVSEIHNALADRTGELAARGEVPRSWADPGRLPWPELVHLIIACIAAGASDPIPRRGVMATLVPRLARDLLDFLDECRPLPALGLRMLRPNNRPRVCRHYGAVLPLIFAAVRRAAGRDEPVFALQVTGRPFMHSQNRHVWNWFVDVSSAEIVAIDLHTALKDRTAAQDVFSTWLDWMELNNVSAFLNLLFFRAAFRPAAAAAAAVQAAMPRLIDPATPRGQSLLYRLAQQPGLQTRARARIVRGLERRAFGAVIPAWRQDIERAPRGIVRVFARVASADAQLEMLDAIGI